MVNMLHLTQLTHQQNVYYVIIITSEAYKLKDNTTIDGHIISSGELVAKAQYIFLYKKVLISFGINIPNSKLLQFQHSKYFIHDLMLPQQQIFMTHPKVYVTGHRQKNQWKKVDRHTVICSG